MIEVCLDDYSLNPLDYDTDREEDDDEKFNYIRKERKQKRYLDRIRDWETPPDLHNYPGNIEVVRGFDNFVTKQEKQKSNEFHRYTKLLFVNDESWLNFLCEKNGDDFRLKHMVDWNSENVILPQKPIEWFNRIPNEVQWGSKK